jgi:hypothetical protein
MLIRCLLSACFVAVIAASAGLAQDLDDLGSGPIDVAALRRHALADIWTKLMADGLEQSAATSARSFAGSFPASGGVSVSSTAISTAGGQNAISMAYVNGKYKIEAVVPAEKGSLKVKLEGSRREIDQQLKKLPKSAQRMIRTQLHLDE